MPGILPVLAMSAVLGVASFCVGVLPLSFPLSRTTLAILTTFGAGLLLGTALGIIIPEGVEMVVTSREFFSKQAVAVPLLFGFKFMLVVDRLLHQFGDHSQAHSNTHTLLPSLEPRSEEGEMNGHVEFDVELGELEQAEGARGSAHSGSASLASDSESKRRAYPLTLGLVAHALTDGFALGSSAVAGTSPSSSRLSTIVFIALIVHKAPTALALATSLLSTSLPYSDCRKHLAVFSASTPIAALISYGVMTAMDMKNNKGWTGAALLFSGGTFLFVATVLQPGKTGSDELSPRLRFLFIILGMVTPMLLSSLVGDVH